MKIHLDKLTLLNFKGIRDLSISYNGTTNILGDNATGKTSVLDGFLWLLFGKDSADRTNFEIKTLGANGLPFQKLSHEVEGLLDVDGVKHSFRRVFQEKWVKRRGSAEEEFDGHATSYYYNDVPVSQSEYMAKVDGLCKESLFRLITNPSYFPSLPWQEQRNIITQIVEQYSNEEIASGVPKFEKLIKLLSGKTIEEFKKEIGAKIKIIKNEIESIPSRMDEVLRGMPKEEKWEELEAELSEKQNLLAKTEEQIGSIAEKAKQEASVFEEKINRLSSVKMQMAEIKMQIESKNASGNSDRKHKIVEYTENISEADRKVQRLNNRIADLKVEITNNQKAIEEYRGKWHAENKKTIEFAEKDFACPTCNRTFETLDIEAKQAEMVVNFNQGKAAILLQITEQGKIKAQKIQEIEAEIGVTIKEIDELNEYIQKTAEKKSDLEKAPAHFVPVDYSMDEEYISLGKIATEIEAELSVKKSLENNDELKEQKAVLTASIDELKTLLHKKIVIKKAKDRLIELEAQLKSQNQALADLENLEFTAEEFTRAKITMIESRVNQKFSIVKFKLFNKQVNGGITETCQATVEGVPYTDLNNAMKINAGLDIINTLQDHFQVYAPIFIDNAESVNSLIPVKTQLVRLVVSNDPELTIMYN